MANENNDISDIVKKCKILLLDIEGTTTSISFVKDKLFPYAEENVKEFLDSQWEMEDVKEVVASLRKLAIEDQEKSVEGVVTIPGEDASKDDQIEALVKSVKWQMSSDRKVGALKQLQGLIWKRGYDKGEIKGHVYDDVSPAMELWRSADGHQVYIYSSGSVQAQKLLFSSSSAGDLLPLIDGHFDTAVGAKQEASSYTTIAEKIGCKPNEILFLTDILKEAEAARAAGLQAALVSREGNAPLAPAAAAFPLLHSLAQLAHTNKRKPDPQEEQPAKVPKTDADDDVKTNGDAEKAPKIVAEKVTEEPEKMEVDEETPDEDMTAKIEEPVAEEPVAKVETIVEEVTDINDVADAPVCDIEPVIEESVDKTDLKETEEMDAEPTEKADPVSEPKAEVQNGDKAPVAEETPPTIITEISEITNDKESLSEVAEIIDDLVPVVEEPAAAQDMEELQNVGEVLEKECDEILSKVQDVTNLDNIPLKPLLNPIPEETMETDNTDSNDIVDRILDSELELDMKQCGDIDLNTVEAITETKTVEEGKGENTEVEKVTEKEEEQPAEEVEATATDKVEEKPTNILKEVEQMVTDCQEESKATEEKPQEGSSTESQADSNKASDVNKEKGEQTVDTEQSKVEKEEIQTETKDDIEKLNEMETEVNKETAETKLDEPKIEENTVAMTESKVESSDSNNEIADKTKQEESNESPIETEKSQVEKESSTEQTMETDALTDSKTPENTTEEVKTDSDATATKVNGKTTNGDAEMVNVNGDANKDVELSSRLSMENGKEPVNGANGDSVDAEQAQGESVTEAEVPDIKVKTVATDEPCTDPIEQPTEA